MVHQICMIMIIDKNPSLFFISGVLGMVTGATGLTLHSRSIKWAFLIFSSEIAEFHLSALILFLGSKAILRMRSGYKIHWLFSESTGYAVKWIKTLVIHQLKQLFINASIWIISKKDFAQPAVHLLGTPVKDFNLNLGDKEHNHTTDFESVFRIPVKVRTDYFHVDLCNVW